MAEVVADALIEILPDSSAFTTLLVREVTAAAQAASRQVSGQLTGAIGVAEKAAAALAAEFQQAAIASKAISSRDLLGVGGAADAAASSLGAAATAALSLDGALASVDSVDLARAVGATGALSGELGAAAAAAGAVDAALASIDSNDLARVTAAAEAATIALGQMAAAAEAVDIALASIDSNDLARVAAALGPIVAELNAASAAALALDQALNSIDSRELAAVSAAANTASASLAGTSASASSASAGLFSLKNIALGTAVGLTALGGVGTYVAGSFEQTQIAFEGLLGSAEEAGAFIKELQDFAAVTPFEFTGLSKSARQLLGVGFAAEEIIPTLTDLGNVAAVLGVGEAQIAGVVRALGQMKGKGKAAGQELLQISEQLPGFSAIQAIADDMGITVEEAFRKMEQGAIPADQAIEAILQGMKEFPGAAGAMDKQAKTLLGLFSTFKDELGIAAIDAFAPLVETLKTSLAPFQDVVVETMTELGAGISEAAKYLIPALSEVLGALGPAFGKALQGVSAALGPSLIAIGELLGAIGEPVLAAIAMLGPAITSGLQPFVDMLGILSPLIETALVESLAAALPGLVAVADGFGEFARSVLPPLAGLLTELAPILGDVINLLGGALGDALAVSAPFFAQILGFARQLLDAFAPLVPALQPVFDAVTTGLGLIAERFSSGDWAPFIDVAVSLADALAQVGGALGDAVLAALEAVLPLIGELRPLLDAITPYWAELAETAGGVLAAALTTIADIFQRLGPYLPPLVDAFTRIVDALAGALIPVLDDLLPILTPLLDVVAALAEPLGVLAVELGDILATAVESVTPVLPELSESLVRIAEALSEVLLAVTPLLPPLLELVSLIIQELGAPALVVIAEAIAFVAEGLSLAAGAVAEVLAAGLGPVVDFLSRGASALANGDWEGFGERFKSGLGKIITFVAELPMKVATEIGKLWLTIGGFFLSLPGRLAGLLTEAGTEMASALGTALTAIPGLLMGAGEAIIRFFAGLPSQIADVFLDLGAFLMTEVFDPAFGFITNELPNMALGFLDWYRSLPGLIVGAVGNLGGFIKDSVLTPAFGFITTDLPNMALGFLDWYRSLPGLIVGAIGDLGMFLKDEVLDPAFGFLINELPAIAGGVINWFTELPGKIVDAIGDLAGRVKDKFFEVGGAILDGILDGAGAAGGAIAEFGKSVANAIIGFVNDKIIANINEGIPDRIGNDVIGVDLPDNPLPFIPKIAHSGGEVGAALASAGRPTVGADEVPVLLQRGEGVLPRDVMRDLGSRFDALRSGALPLAGAAAAGPSVGQVWAPVTITVNVTGAEDPVAAGRAAAGAAADEWQQRTALRTLTRAL